MKIPFVQVDAFADAPFTGNPAAVMRLEAWLDDDVLQAIAEENKLSETAFIVVDASGQADFELRWFTPAAEVMLCGHATLASGHVVLTGDPARERVRFATRHAGVLDVSREGDGYALKLPAWTPHPRAMPEIIAALGVTGIVETLWHEKGYPLVIVDDAATVRACDPDMRALAAHPVVAIVSARGTATDIVSRVFTPAYGIDEDPVTGSAHAVMTPYWASAFGRDAFTACQASARGGHLTCRLDGDHVVLGGRCMTVIEGVFLLP